MFQAVFIGVLGYGGVGAWAFLERNPEKHFHARQMASAHVCAELAGVGWGDGVKGFFVAGSCPGRPRESVCLMAFPARCLFPRRVDSTQSVVSVARLQYWARLQMQPPKVHPTPQIGVSHTGPIPSRRRFRLCKNGLAVSNLGPFPFRGRFQAECVSRHRAFPTRGWFAHVAKRTVICLNRGRA